MTTMKYQDPPGSGNWVTLGTVGAPGTDGVGIPAGGTTAQLLRKKSATDYDTEWFSPPRGRVRKTSALALSAGVFTNIPWDTEDYDVGYGGQQCVDLAANNLRLFAPITGYYQTRCCVGFNYVANNRLGMRVVNNATVVLEKTAASTLSVCSLDVGMTMLMTAGTGVYFQAYSQVAGSLTTAAYYNWAELRWVGPP